MFRSLITRTTAPLIPCVRPSALSLRTLATASHRFLVADGVDPSACAMLSDAGFTVDERPKLPKEELLGIIGNYEGVIVRSASKITADVLEQAPNLKLIGRAGTGVDNIDVDAATDHGVLVINTPGGNTTSAAELAFSLLMALVRKVPHASKDLKGGDWARSKYSKGTEVRGKTIGIVGLGRIGQRVAQFARGLGMDVIGYDEKVAFAPGVRRVSLEQLFERSDFISLHTPLVDSTRHLINKDTLEQCKDGVHIINAARGGIVHEKDLLDALNSGKVAGAALDVFEAEPKAPEFFIDPDMQALIDHPNVVTTPHLGASTEEAQVSVATDIARQFIDGIQGKGWVGVVNAPHVAISSQPKYAPWVQTASALGTLAQALCQDVTSIGVEAYGEVFEGDAVQRLMRAAAAKGFLAKQSLDVEPNEINSEKLAETLGVALTSGAYASRPGPTPTFVRLSVTTASGVARTFAASYVGSEVRITQIDEWWASFPSFKAEGSVLLYTSEDHASILNKVICVVADNNLNVGILGSARDDSGKRISYLTIDDDVPKSVVSEIAALRDIDSAHLVEF